MSVAHCLLLTRARARAEARWAAGSASAVRGKMISVWTGDRLVGRARGHTLGSGEVEATQQ